MADWNNRGARRRFLPQAREDCQPCGLPMVGRGTGYRGRARNFQRMPLTPHQYARRPEAPPERFLHYGRAVTYVPRNSIQASSKYQAPIPAGLVSTPARQSLGSNENTSELSSSTSHKDLANPIWPAAGFCKIGTLGVPTKLFANYFAFERNFQMSIYQYHVKFYPDVEDIFMRRAMIYQHVDVVGQQIVFDGMVLWSFNMLEKEVTELFATRLSDGVKIRIEIKFILTTSPNDPVTLQILGNQMRKYFAYIGFKQLRSDYFDVKNSVVEHGLELIPGYSTAIHQYENKVLVNCSLNFRVMPCNNVLKIIHDCERSGENFQKECEKKLLGKIVVTKYNYRTYRIAEISWNIHPSDIFNRKGQFISYTDYMKQAWSLTVDDPSQPMLLSKPKMRDIRRGENKPILLIPQFCFLTGIDDETRQNFSLMRDIANRIRMNPSQHVQQLQTLINRLKTNEQVQREMKEWGLDFATNLQEIPGRILQPEGIIVTDDKNDRGVQYNPGEANWSKILRSKRLLESARLANWIVICTCRDQYVANDFIHKMRDICPRMGMTITNPALVLSESDRTQSYIQSMSRYVGTETKMVVAIISPDRKELYDAIKKKCCVEYGILSQVITNKTLGKQNTLMSVISDIAIQMNCKLGGQAWRVNTSLTGTMVVGIATYHDIAQRNVSVCAVVCSTNSVYTKYYNQIEFQPKAQYMSNVLGNHIAEGLRRHFELNKKLPDRVIIYRDGVADGQIQSVREWEVKQVVEGFTQLGTNYNPELTFVAVNKNITTRLFTSAYPCGDGVDYDSHPNSSTSGYGTSRGGYGTSRGGYGARPRRGYGVRPGSSHAGYDARPGPLIEGSGAGLGQNRRRGFCQNPLPGTVVDSVITRNDRYDFFLISHSVRQGTVSPTYYNVIYTTSNMSVNDLQLFTFQLCHLYYNWQGTVHVPVPIQYARKLASLVGDFLHAAPSDALADNLHYL